MTAPAATSLTLEQLTAINAARCARWHGANWRFADRDRTASHLGLAASDEWSGADWANAMQGEAGEAGNVVKKLRRLELGLPGNRTPEDDDRATLIGKLEAELADTLIYLDLLASYYGISLAAALTAKFNRVSEELGMPERLPTPGDRVWAERPAHEHDFLPLPTRGPFPRVYCRTCGQSRTT